MRGALLLVALLGCDELASEGDVLSGCADAQCQGGDAEAARFGSSLFILGRDDRVLLKRDDDIVTLDDRLEEIRVDRVGPGELFGGQDGQVALYADETLSFRDPETYADLWSVVVGRARFAMSPHRVIVVPDDGEIRWLRADTGELVSTRARAGIFGVLPLPDDGVILSEMVGDVASITRLDANGGVVWTLVVPAPGEQSEVAAVSAGRRGEAVVIVGNFTGPSLAIGAATLPKALPASVPRPRDRTQYLGVLDGATGAVRWVRTIGVTKDRIQGAWTDGRDVFVSGTYDNGPLGFASLSTPAATAGFVVRLTSTDAVWARKLVGAGDVSAFGLGPIGDSLLVGGHVSGRSANVDDPSFLQLGDLRFDFEGNGSMIVRVRQ